MVKVTLGEVHCDNCEAILARHHKSDGGAAGMTDGYCAECDMLWPCQTYHLAMGWGDTYYHCIEAKWCQHIGDVMR